MPPPLRKRVRANPAERRGQILDQAVRLIGERGYYGFSIRELADRCQLTDPGLLHYFGSKANLLIAVLEDCDRRGAETVRNATGLGPVRDQQLTFGQLRAIFRAIVRRNVAEPELLRLYAVLRTEAVNPSHPAHAFFKRRQAGILETFARPLADYVAEPWASALQVQSMMRGLEMEWLRAEQAFDLVAEWDRAFDLLFPVTAGEQPDHRAS